MVHKMEAVWLENNKLSFRKNFPQPEPLEDEALVKVRQAGICGTDLELVKGYYPFNGIPGHEFVGEIVHAPLRPQREGERVVGEINVSCGACPSCLAERQNHCEKRTVLGIKDRNGAFAEYVCLPLANLITLADVISDDAAVFVEPLAAALEIQNQIKINCADRVLVLGAGRLGQLISQSLVHTGCELNVVARYKKQQKLLDKCNIPWIDERKIPMGYFDLVVEATGSAEGFSLARRAVRPRGTIVLKSTYKGDIQANFSSIVVDEITIVGSRCGPFSEALHFIEKKLVDPTMLIEGRYPLSEVLKAVEQAAQPGALKVILQIAN